jgi:rhamnose transport system ATP-binding protein
MISSELPEVLGMADRVLVMHEGRLSRELSRAEADEESVIRAATGVGESKLSHASSLREHREGDR